jgi:putative polyhydroxyalkanoate system protein
MIDIRRHHDLGLTKAKRLAQRLADKLQSELGGTWAWKGNELHFQRTGASGFATVTKDSVQIRVELGFLLRPLRARIEREIRAGLDEHLGHEDARRAGRSPEPT